MNVSVYICTYVRIYVYMHIFFHANVIFISQMLNSSFQCRLGTQANDLHFQAYLLEGLMRWNEDRATDALASSSRVEARDRSFSGSLKQAVNELHQKVFGSVLDKNLRSPRLYTGLVTLCRYIYFRVFMQ